MLTIYPLDLSIIFPIMAGWRREGRLRAQQLSGEGRLMDRGTVATKKVACYKDDI